MATGTGGDGQGTQLEMPGMPRRLFPATPSKLASFGDCPRRYRFAYLDRPTPAKGPPWAHNSVGPAVHAALRSWWELPVERRLPGRRAVAAVAGAGRGLADRLRRRSRPGRGAGGYLSS